MFSTKVWNIHVLGLFHDDELGGLFKWPSKPNFINSLCVILVSLFLQKLFRYYMFIRPLNYIPHFIRKNIRFKVIHIRKILAYIYCVYI